MLISITSKRKAQFCRHILSATNSKIGFADVGSGGPLKSPWNLLPCDKIDKFDFDPEDLATDELPICISNQVGKKSFYIARDSRSSSLHQASQSFVERFNQPATLPTEVISVMCTTLDQHFKGHFDDVDLMDINVEGHDYQVLQGATQLLEEGFVKCIKVEFELTEVWHGQGWFSDIDPFLRHRQYDLVNIVGIDHARPANVKTIYHKGEILWGKAIYFPNLASWLHRQKVVEPKVYQDELLKAIVLYTILNMPGRAIDLLTLNGNESNLTLFNKDEITSEIFSVFKYAMLDEIYLRASELLYRIGKKVRVLS